MSTRRARFPLISIGVAYVGFAASWGVLFLLSTPEYEHASYLQLGLVALAWSLLALASAAVSTTNLVLNFQQLGRWLRWVTVALNVPVAIAVAGGLTLSISVLQDYAAGFAAYDAAAQLCGHPPVLAWSGYGAHYILPSNSDYNRLKYSAKDPSIWTGPLLYFCTAADAEAHGIPQFS
jgi:hypothetical protein